MEKELADITKDENTAIAEFESLVAAKEKEIAAATEAIEMKTEKNGEMAVKIVNLKNDLEDAQDALGEDQKFVAELKKGCATAEKDYEARKAGRAEEAVAVAETIKILNDDDALDLFKKTLPSPTLLQMTQTSRNVRDEALAAFGDLKDQKHSTQLGMIQLALMGKKAGFEKIIKMLDRHPQPGCGNGHWRQQRSHQREPEGFCDRFPGIRWIQGRLVHAMHLSI